MKLFHKLKGLFQSKKINTYTGTSVTDKELSQTPAWGNSSIPKSISALTGVCCYGEAAVCAYKDSRGILHDSVEHRDKAEKSYLLYDARSEYYKALHTAYSGGSWYDHPQNEVKDLINAAQKYYDLCTDIS